MFVVRFWRFLVRSKNRLSFWFCSLGFFFCGVKFVCDLRGGNRENRIIFCGVGGGGGFGVGRLFI